MAETGGKKRVRIAVSTIFQDAGEATRSIEIMKIIRDAAPEGYAADAVFFTHGSKFDEKALAEGFALQRVEPAMEGQGYLEDFKPTLNNLIGDRDLARRILRGEMEAQRDCKPDLILHGFWPVAGIARKLQDPVIPAVCFVPIPFERSMFGTELFREIPDRIMPVSLLPRAIQHKLVRAIPLRVKLKVPNLKQTNLAAAAAEEAAAVRREPARDLFDMLKADCMLVNDLSYFYRNIKLPEGFVLTGPLYSQASTADPVDPAILNVFRRRSADQVNLFCTMGSSAQKEFLVEAVKAIAALPKERYRAVVLVPKAVCPIGEITPLVREGGNILLTDKFVPAKRVNELADITICHGGQGTIQTAMASGCPLIGFAMQPEQQMNLDHVVQAGAGVRIHIAKWKKRAIYRAICDMSGDTKWKRNAENLRAEMQKEDARTKIAETVWAFIRQKVYGE